MVVLAALILFLSALAGIAFAPVLARNRRTYSIAIAFAAGSLLTIILVHVLPEAMHSHARAPMLFVAGFVGMLLLHQHVLRADPCCGHEHAQHAGLPSFLALALCSLNDGIVMSVDADSGMQSPLLWGLAVHELNAGFALAMLLREVHGSRWQGLRRTYLVVFAAVAPLTLIWANSLSTAPWIPLVLACSGGALLYVVAGSLVPRVEHLAREGRAAVVVAFLAAVALNLGMTLLHDHGPAHEAGHSHGPEDSGHSHGDRAPKKPQ